MGRLQGQVYDLKSRDFENQFKIDALRKKLEKAVEANKNLAY